MDKNNMAFNAAKKKKHILDQMASMHFKLSDEYKLKSVLEDIFEISISIILCGITFLDLENYFSISDRISSLIMGFISIGLLIFTFSKQIVNYKQLCEKHQLSGKMYAQAKLELSSQLNKWEINNTNSDDILEYLNNHFDSLNDLPQIPEKHFNRLKHSHQHKVAMSKFLDDYHDNLWFICQIRFALKGIKKNSSDIEIQKNTKAIVLRMLKAEKYTLQEISDISGVSIDEIKKIQA